MRALTELESAESVPSRLQSGNLVMSQDHDRDVVQLIPRLSDAAANGSGAVRQSIEQIYSAALLDKANQRL